MNEWVGGVQATVELMHKDIITNFSNFVCGMDILRAALTQLLLYYTRLSDCVKVRGPGLEARTPEAYVQADPSTSSKA